MRSIVLVSPVDGNVILFLNKETFVSSSQCSMLAFLCKILINSYMNMISPALYDIYNALKKLLQSPLGRQ